jgi:hypothetical protein
MAARREKMIVNTETSCRADAPRVHLLAADPVFELLLALEDQNAVPALGKPFRK